MSFYLPFNPPSQNDEPTISDQPAEANIEFTETLDVSTNPDKRYKQANLPPCRPNAASASASQTGHGCNWRLYKIINVYSMLHLYMYIYIYITRHMCFHLGLKTNRNMFQ